MDIQSSARPLEAPSVLVAAAAGVEASADAAALVALAAAAVAKILAACLHRELRHIPSVDCTVPKH